MQPLQPWEAFGRHAQQAAVEDVMSFVVVVLGVIHPEERFVAKG